MGAGSAFAYLSSQGTGGGTVTVGALEPAVVEHATGTLPTTEELSPGHAADLQLSLTNPNSYQVTVTGVTEDGTITVTGGGGGCTTTTAGVSISAGVASGLDVALTPGVHTITVATGASMTGTSSTTCQTASFHIPVDVTVHT
ncbi:MAG: hypothetical protein ACRDWE_03775 [Acidimicrobiales bacterium]